MRNWLNGLAWLPVSAVALLAIVPAAGAEHASSQTIAPIYERFAASDDKPSTAEVPDFQKHISPLLGRLGCNGRACHGSFQGQGGFQLSLFGYDFQADYKALLEDGATRVDLDDKLESLILTKPVDADMHEGGMRYEQGSWQYWALRRWIEAGAPYNAKQLQKLSRLEITPHELSFSESGESQPLKAIAYWENGTSEDVTCLCRFQSNDAAIANIDETGLVTSGEPGDTHIVVSYDNAVVPVLAIRPMSKLTGENYPRLAANTEIDRHIAQKLQKLAIVPSEICTDEEFLRRASLDVTGTLPLAQEVVAFVSDGSSDKRHKKIEELLSRPGYAAHWTTFLCDVTGNNSDQLRNFMPQTVKPENQWYQWILKRMQQNLPYDQMVEGIVTATSRLPDESYMEYCEAMSDICRDTSGEKFADRPGLVHYWARNNFKTAEDRAIGFAYSFLGVRIQCAQCHKHPFDQWSKTDFDNFEKLFGAVRADQNERSPEGKKQVADMLAKLSIDKSLKGNLLRKELGVEMMRGKTVPLPELTVSTPAPKRTGKGKASEKADPPEAKLLGGDWIAMDEADVRVKLMAWLRAPENPYFAKAIVNRVWAQYFGVGIVNPADDLNLANAPSNAPLLDYLAAGFIENAFDFHWLHRQILNSDAYQRSWIPNETNALDKHNFSHSMLRRLPAEASYDAVRMALVNNDYAEKAQNLEVPRAITEPGSSARAQGSDDQAYALTVFGRSVRESNCDCDRSSEPSLLQTVFLVNDSAVLNWLSDPKLSWVSSVADKFGWEKSRNASNVGANGDQLKKMRDRFSAQMQDIDKRLAAAKEKGLEKQLASLQKRKADMEETVRKMAKRNGSGSEQATSRDGQPELVTSEPSSLDRMTEEQALWVAENAYLRTVGRLPRSNELATAVSYLRSENNPITAVEGLMWSMVNTKEFILNH